MDHHGGSKRLMLTGLLFLIALKSGAGITAGTMPYFDDSFFNVLAGTGVKMSLAADSRLAVNLGVTFQRLLDLNQYGTARVNYLRFNIGLEF